MKNYKAKYFAAIFFAVCVNLSAQKSGDIEINADANFDIRKISNEYFGNPDLWQYILKYNNLENLGDLKPGRKIKIPQKKVNDLLSKLEVANKAVITAVQIGAKVLADDLLEKASRLYREALNQKELFNFDQAEKSADDAINMANSAFQKTKEIREKTINAIISFKKGTVQKRFPSVLKWQDADVYDNLKENDWARTLTFSLADITFYDLSQIKLNENSQAVIQSSRYDALSNKTTTKVKLEKGDAYAKLFTSPKKRFDLDIPGVKTKINSKYFWVEKNNNNSKVANYNGEISLEVKDSAVVVQKNQGSVIPEGGFPTKPKNLLPAPEILSPQNYAKIIKQDLLLSWSEINSASGYRVEIGMDTEFKTVYNSINGITDKSYEVKNIPPGIYYWHVCSADSAGLPGPYSPANSFIVVLDKNKPFLNVEYPPHNFTSHDKNIFVKVKTEPSVKLFVQQKSVAADSSGFYQGTIQVEDGRNEVVFKAVNNAGYETTIIKNIYCETNPEIKITDKVFGPLENGKTITSKKNIVKLNISTRPLSRVEIKSDMPGFVRTVYSDSIGNCRFEIPLKVQYDKYNITVDSPAGYKKEIIFKILNEARPLQIILNSSLEQAVKSNEYIFKGIAEGTEQLFINGNKIEIDGSGNFESKQMLNKRNNLFQIEAVDAAGAQTVLEKNILFDNQPPELKSYDFKKNGNDNSVYSLSIIAADETSLKKSAVAEIQFNGNIINEILELIPGKNIYEGFFNFTGNNKPVLMNITLEDYLGNSKTYSVNK